jgi:DUF971 family protein
MLRGSVLYNREPATILRSVANHWVGTFRVDIINRRPSLEEISAMTATGSDPKVPVSLTRDGPDHLLIVWRDGLRGRVSWRDLRAACPCATCRDERDKPPDPFRVLKPSELAPLAPVSMPSVGRYAYKIVWSDGHDTGIYTVEQLRSLSEAHPHPGSP